MNLVIMVLFWLLASCSEPTSPIVDEFKVTTQIIYEDFYHAKKVISTHDSSFAIAGFSKSEIDTNSLVPSILKIDESGEEIWRVKLELESTYDVGYVKSFLETKSNDFIISGGWFEGVEPSYIARFDSLGNLLWAKDFNSLGIILTPRVIENEMDEIVVVGTGWENKIRVIKFDKYGTLIWDNSYEYEYQVANEYKVRFFRDFSIGSNDRITPVFIARNDKIIVLHIDSDGSQNYSSIYNYNIDYSPFFNIITRENNDYIFGTNIDPDSKVYPFLIDHRYATNYGFTHYNRDIKIDDIHNVYNTLDGGFIMSSNKGIIKSNEELEFEWIHDFTNIDHESTHFNDIIEISEKKYAMISRINTSTISEKTVFRIFQEN